MEEHRTTADEPTPIPEPPSMTDTWTTTKDDIGAAVRASSSMQEKAYYASTLALMTIAESLREMIHRDI